MIALASWPAGHVTQLTAALPSALAAVGTALVVFAVGRSLFNFDPIVLVSYPDAAAPRAGSRP